MSEHRLSILHISDLHARSRDVDELPEDDREKRRHQVRLEAASRRDVLGDAWDENLRELYPNGERPDLVCFTGDVADWGLRSEYTEATKLVDRLVAVLGVERSRIYVVPGNHDVRRTNPDRKEDKEPHERWAGLRKLLWSDTSATSSWLAGRSPPRAVEQNVLETVMGRTASFWYWVEHGLGRPELLPARHAHGRLGYHHVPTLPHLPFPVHVIGLDSAWLAGDEHDQGQLWLTQPQRDLLLRDEDGEPWNEGFRLALVHHPIGELAQPELEPTRRELANAVHLLLHGHQHEPVGANHIDLDGRVLGVLAAGCLFEGGKGSRWKNGCHRIDVALDDKGQPRRAEIHFRAWSSRGHWHSDSSLYRGLKDGRLVWHAWGGDWSFSRLDLRARSRTISHSIQRIPLTKTPRSPTTTSPICPRELPSPPADFTGRSKELKQLHDDYRSGTTILGVCGMGGAGKTALLLMFAEQIAHEFLGGQIYIDLQGADEANLLSPTDAYFHTLNALEPQLQDDDSGDPSRLAGRYRSVLHGRRILIFLDNARDQQQIKALIPPHGCFLLLTSRQRFSLPGYSPTQLHSMSPTDSQALIHKIVPRVSDDDALQLSRLCGHHALAVETASRVLSECLDLGVSDYIRRLSKESERLDLCDASIELSYKLLASDLQRHWCALSVVRVPFNQRTASFIWRTSADEAQKRLSTLLRYNLLQWDSTDQKYRFHDLAYLSAKARLSSKEQMIAWARLAASRRRGGDTISRVVYVGNLPWDIDHHALRSHFSSFGPSRFDCTAVVVTDRMSGMSKGFGYVLYKKISSAILSVGALHEAVMDGRRVVVNFRRSQPDDDDRDQDEWLGNHAARVGNLTMALEMFQRSLQTREKLAKADPHSAQAQRNLSIALNKLGEIEVQAGNLVSARELVQRSLEVAEGLAKADPHNTEAAFDVVLSLLRLASLAQQEGDIETRRKVVTYANECLDAMDAMGQITGYQKREAVRELLHGMAKELESQQ